MRSDSPRAWELIIPFLKRDGLFTLVSLFSCTRCECVKGWEGHHCQNNIMCMDNLCKNGGECQFNAIKLTYLISRSVKALRGCEWVSQFWWGEGRYGALASHSLQFACVASDDHGINSRGFNQSMRVRILPRLHLLLLVKSSRVSVGHVHSNSLCWPQPVTQEKYQETTFQATRKRTGHEKPASCRTPTHHAFSIKRLNVGGIPHMAVN